MITHTPIGSIISSDLPKVFSMIYFATVSLQNDYRSIRENK
jgi:hypothetical protein